MTALRIVALVLSLISLGFAVAGVIFFVKAQKLSRKAQRLAIRARELMHAEPTAEIKGDDSADDSSEQVNIEMLQAEVSMLWQGLKKECYDFYFAHRKQEEKQHLDNIHKWIALYFEKEEQLAKAIHKSRRLTWR